jgi:hypothetical protein
MRMARWSVMTEGDVALGVAGVVGKALTLPGLIVAAIGLAAGPVVFAGGLVLAVWAFAVWLNAARVLGHRVGESTARAMWTIWTIPTWSFLGDLLDFLSIF